MPFAFVPRRPSAPLSRYVEMLWWARGRIGYGSERILPTGKANMLIVLGDAIEQQVAGDPVRSLIGKRGFVSGFQNRALVNRPLGETYAVGASFTSGGAFALLGLPGHELTDRVVELDAIWGRAATRLRDRVGEARSAESALDVLEAGLLDRLRPHRNAVRIEIALGYLQRPAPPSIGQLAAAIGISHKHLIHVCKTLVGATPKRLARIYRFNRLLGAIDPVEPRWAEIGVDSGYADQSHMVREFRDLAGMTPTQYLTRRDRGFGGSAATAPKSFVPDAG